ncbi:MAG: di-trans,poly-cis-decaprenylcistransferase [Ruminococcaceae bacterium]|nr:di-trans,poly-cis-decaprenylcistransferase [Oscillospiraceae bacterium]
MPEKKGAEGLSIGIIMDGNGRWAKQRGLPRTAGHKVGADVFDDIALYAKDIGVRALTFFAFSTENWQRPKDEVKAIMDLFGQALKRIEKYRKEDNQVVFLGDRTPLLPEYQKRMADIEAKTAHRTGMILNIAINYGGREELVRAAQQLAQEAADGKIKPSDIDNACIEKHLYTSGQPMPDFILRTSGEHRISNFMLWQSAYSEFIFVDTLWPDFTPAHFDAAVAEYHRRDRRYGGL